MSRACLSTTHNSSGAIKLASLAQAFSGNAMIASSASMWQSKSSCHNQNSEQVVSVTRAPPPVTLAPVIQISQPQIITRSTIPVARHLNTYSAHCPNCVCPVRPEVVARQYIAVPAPVLSTKIRIPPFNPISQPLPPPPPPPAPAARCSGELAIKMVQDLSCRMNSDLSILQTTVDRNWDAYNTSRNDWRTMVLQAIEKSEAAASQATASMSIGRSARDSAEHTKSELLSMNQRLINLNSTIANAISQAESAHRCCQDTNQEVRRLDATSQQFRSLLDGMTSQMRQNMTTTQREINAAHEFARQAMEESKKAQNSVYDVRTLAERNRAEVASAAHGAQMAQDIAQRVMQDVNSMKSEIADSKAMAQKSLVNSENALHISQDVKAMAQKGLVNSENALHISQDLKSLIDVVRNQLKETKSELTELKHTATSAASLAQSTAAEVQSGKSKLNSMQNKIDQFNSRLENAEDQIAGYQDEIRAWKARTIEAAKFVDSAGIRSR